MARHGVEEWLQGNRVCGRIIGGEVAEWPIAPVLKTGEVRASAGSNPALSAKLVIRLEVGVR